MKGKLELCQAITYWNGETTGWPTGNCYINYGHVAVYTLGEEKLSAWGEDEIKAYTTLSSLINLHASIINFEASIAQHDHHGE